MYARYGRLVPVDSNTEGRENIVNGVGNSKKRASCKEQSYRSVIIVFIPSLTVDNDKGSGIATRAETTGLDDDLIYESRDPGAVTHVNRGIDNVNAAGREPGRPAVFFHFLIGVGINRS